MSVREETIDATLDPSGHLSLAHWPRVTPGPVRVTIRVAAAAGRRGAAWPTWFEPSPPGSAPAASLDGRRRRVSPKTKPAEPRTTNATGNWRPGLFH